MYGDHSIVQVISLYATIDWMWYVDPMSHIKVHKAKYCSYDLTVWTLQKLTGGLLIEKGVNNYISPMY